MTAGSPIYLGDGPLLGVAVYLGGAATGPGVTGPPPASSTTLTGLTDVDAPPDVPGVLERQDDGQVRPVSRAEVIAAHVTAPAPHPAYDDMPRLTLYFENGLI